MSARVAIMPAASATTTASGAAALPSSVVIDDPFAAATTDDGRKRAATSSSSSRRTSCFALFAERLDWALVLPFAACAGLLGYYVLNDVEPYRRAVYAADRTIAMPTVPRTKQMPNFVAPLVPGMVLLGVAIFVEMFVPVLLKLRAGKRRKHEGVESAAIAATSSTSLPLIGGRPAHTALSAAALVRTFGGAVVALCAVGCMTEFLKIFCGRPRPDFLTRCAPKIPASSADPTELLDRLVLSAPGQMLPGGGFGGAGGANNALPPIECTSADMKNILESRKSFPSGHSSSAASAGLWGAMYVLYSARRFAPVYGPASVFGGGGSKAIILPRLARDLFASAAILLSLFFLAWPWGVGATRFVDNRHHPSDIVGGILLGTFFTVPFFARFVAVSDAWDRRDAASAWPAAGAAVAAAAGGGPALATQV
jgi:membrane-associated phospholipid phosphatase